MAGKTQFTPGKVITMAIGTLTVIGLIVGAVYTLDSRFMKVEDGLKLGTQIALVSERLEGKILTDRWWQVDRYLRRVIPRTGPNCTRGPQRDIDQCLHLVRQRSEIEQEMERARVPTPGIRR